MIDLFTWCAWIGGTILVGQTLLALIGAGADDLDGGGGLDADLGDAAHHGILGPLSVRALVAFSTFFGLAGLAAHSGELDSSTTLVIALAAGLAAVAFVAQAMRWIAKLQSSGTIDMRRAIGSRGRVYLRVPAHGEGQGRVHVDVQGRRIEVRALARADAIPTGAEVRVVDLAPDGALIVEPCA